jgi:hydrogenase nickel incorporation protein HypB
MAQLDLEVLDVLLIENVGNLICPVGFDLGQHDKVGMFGVGEGDDKAAKHPHLVSESSVLLLNKTDLLPYVPFDQQAFVADVERLNPQAAVLPISVAAGEIGPWLDWLRTRVSRMGGVPLGCSGDVRR